MALADKNKWVISHNGQTIDFGDQRIGRARLRQEAVALGHGRLEFHRLPTISNLEGRAVFVSYTNCPRCAQAVIESLNPLLGLFRFGVDDLLKVTCPGAKAK